MARNVDLVALLPPASPSLAPLASYSTGFPHAPDNATGARVVPWSRSWAGGHPPTPFSVNLAGVALFSQCSSIYIDNTNCPFQINVDFAFGTPTIICPAGGSGWFPVVVNNLVCVVSAVNGIPGRSGTTSIWFANFIVPPVYVPPQPDTLYPSWQFVPFDNGSPQFDQNAPYDYFQQLGVPNYGLFVRDLRFSLYYVARGNGVGPQAQLVTVTIGGVIVGYKRILIQDPAPSSVPATFCETLDFTDLDFLSSVPYPVLGIVFTYPGVADFNFKGVLTCQVTPQLNN